MPAYTLKLYRFADSSAVREDVACLDFEAPADPAALAHAHTTYPDRLDGSDYWVLLQSTRVVRDAAKHIR